MASSEAVGGTAFFRINGTQYNLLGSFKIGATKTKRDAVVGQDGVHGYNEKRKAPYIECEISDMGSLSLLDLESMTDETITAELNNGKVYTLSNAWYAGEGELDATEGKTTARFEGMDMDED